MAQTTCAGIVLDIQRYSIHDGPGIRTVAFLKGCPLRCDWCSNPESQISNPEILVNCDACIKCKKCEHICPKRCIDITPQGPVLERANCDGCMQCADHCPGGALMVSGKTMTVNELARQLRKDEAFFRESGGGVTLSGGEAMLQASFCEAVMAEMKNDGISVVIETCGICRWEDLKSVAGQCEMILYDIKEMNPEKHKLFTGADNKVVLENARNLIREDFPVIFRIPLIPGRTATTKNMEAIALFLSQNGYNRAVYLLPYHNYGEHKYAYLGRSYPLSGADMLTAEQLDELAACFQPYAIPVIVGGQAM